MKEIVDIRIQENKIFHGETCKSKLLSSISSSNITCSPNFSDFITFVLVNNPLTTQMEPLFATLTFPNNAR